MSTLTERLERRTLRPCTACGGLGFFAGNIGYEHATGSRTHWFDLLICKGCGKTETFVAGEPDEWVQRRCKDHEFVELTARPG